LVKKNTGLMGYITKNKVISKDHHLYFDRADSKDHSVLYITKDYNKCAIHHEQQFDPTNSRCKTKGSTKKNSKNPEQLITNCEEYGLFDYNINDLDNKTDNNDKSSAKNFNNPKIMAAIEEKDQKALKNYFWKPTIDYNKSQFVIYNIDKQTDIIEFPNIINKLNLSNYDPQIEGSKRKHGEEFSEDIYKKQRLDFKNNQLKTSDTKSEYNLM
ncbi:30328_t:CDS:2, partial [Gigaspora margarita]